MRNFPKWLLFVLLFLLLTKPAAAEGPQGKPFGLGLSLGEPAGLSAKLWFDRASALDLAFGYGFWPHGGPAFYADYVYHVYEAVKPGMAPFHLYLYLGGGLKLAAWYYRDHPDEERHYGFGLGVRFPFGLTMVFTKAPFDVFLELVPAMAFISPAPLYFDFDGCLGGRFYF